ncbi:interleukin-27 subunit alpha isoform X1 [Lynx canadensis]|uniref:interleukin-27 subunit alpha isoform X1 n=1 Tax=Lynx canadensis TaxID=61383 RepID=UPI0011B0C952|nr:interleukin-27 subunit alpha isoform X1 [Lynx canadensis]
MEPEICLQMWAFCARPCPPRRRGTFLSFRQRCRMVSSIASMLLVALRGQQNGTQALPTAQAQKGHVEFFSGFPPTWPTISPLSPGLSLLLLSLLLARAGVWGFPRPPGRPPLSLQELRREFKVSLHLARKLFSEVRTQAHRFVSLSLMQLALGTGESPIPLAPPLTDLAPQAESHLPGVSLDLLPLGDRLPNVSLTFQAWHSLSDPERLCFLFMTLRPFHALLGSLGSQGGWTSSEKIELWTMRLDLRDLQRHLHFQVLAAGLNLPEEEDDEERKEPLPAPSGLSRVLGQPSWPQLLYTYQLLHSLELVLARAVRDLLLLSQAGNPAPASGSSFGSRP